MFDLLVVPGYEFPFTDIVLISDLFATLPNHPEILYCCFRVDMQTNNLNQNTLFEVNEANEKILGRFISKS